MDWGILVDYKVGEPQTNCIDGARSLVCGMQGEWAKMTPDHRCHPSDIPTTQGQIDIRPQVSSTKQINDNKGSGFVLSAEGVAGTAGLYQTRAWSGVLGILLAQAPCPRALAEGAGPSGMYGRLREIGARTCPTPG